jgi:hypothetical protein
MSTTHTDARPAAADCSQPIKRRGLFAVGAALVGGLVAKLSETTLQAGVDGDVILGGNGGQNTATRETAILNNSSASPATPVILGFRSPGAVVAVTLAVNAGVLGETFVADAPGVQGRAPSGSQAKGVHGISNSGYGVFGEGSTGVHGESTGGNGVEGVITSASSASAIGVYGLNYSTYAGPGPGAGGFGVYGLSAKGHGLVGATATAGGAAVVGATNGVAGAYAAAFYGPVIVGGDFTVVGGAKSAAVPHPDGTHRRLYCVESPESWFEDFGRAELACGEAQVTLDPEFAAVADVSDYHVFLTAYDTHADLCIAEQTSQQFRVLAKDPASSGRFSWRVVAKRRDIAGDRFARVTIPPEPVLPTVPSVRAT